MAEAAVAEEIAPLLVKDELDNLLGKDSEAELASVTTVNTKRTGCSLFAFLYQRSTYYWIAFIAQFSQVTLLTIALAVAVAHKEFKDKDGDTTYTADVFVFSGFYSLLTLTLNASLILVHHKGTNVGPKRITAGKHCGAARFAALLNFFNLSLLVGPISRHGENTYNDEIRPIIVPLIVGFIVVSLFANITAAYITYAAAKRARGTDPVPDPDYRVPAWTLSTTEESQGLWRQKTIQLPL